jgi:hypothetical protein
LLGSKRASEWVMFIQTLDYQAFSLGFIGVLNLLNMIKMALQFSNIWALL